jgi:predicted nucleic acid-binding protein
MAGKSTNALLWLEKLRKTYALSQPTLTQKQRDARAKVSAYLTLHNDPIPQSYVAEVAGELRLREKRPVGISFDASMLLALERRDLRPRAIWMHLVDEELPITITSHVVAEVWRPNQNQVIDGLLDAVSIEPINIDLAIVAGIAVSAVHEKLKLPPRRLPEKRQEPGLIDFDRRQAHLEHIAMLEANTEGLLLADAFLMASAATRGDTVYTSHYDDCSLIREHCFNFVDVVGF